MIYAKKKTHFTELQPAKTSGEMWNQDAAYH